MTTEFKYQLGEIVCIDPTGEGRGVKGKVVGQVTMVDGRGYLVSVAQFNRNFEQAVVRHLLGETEICYPEKPHATN